MQGGGEKEVERKGEWGGQGERQLVRSLRIWALCSNFSQVVPGFTLLQLKGVSGFIRTQALIYNPPCKTVLCFS